jgi:hypothetical protein
MMFFYILGCCRHKLIVLGGKLKVVLQKKDRNPYCICLVLNVPKHSTSPKRSPGGKIWVPIDIFFNIKASKGPQVSTKDV